MTNIHLVFSPFVHSFHHSTWLECWTRVWCNLVEASAMLRHALEAHNIDHSLLGRNWKKTQHTYNQRRKVKWSVNSNYLYRSRLRVEIKLFYRESQIFSGGHILTFFPENIKYWELLCVKLLFRCKLSKTAPQPHFGTFPEGVDHGSRGSNPRQILICPGYQNSIKLLTQSHNHFQGLHFYGMWLPTLIKMHWKKI